MAFLGDTARDILRKTAAGMAFGAALTASRVYQPVIILDQMRLADFTMLKTFLTAVSSSSFIMLLVERAADWKRPVRAGSSMKSGWLSTQYDGNIIGGALIGIGMGLAGACPGTVIIQLAQGIASSRWTLLGALLGGLVHARQKQRTMYRRIPGRPRSPASLASNNLTPSETIMSKFNLSESFVLAAFGAVFAGLVGWSLYSRPYALRIFDPLTGGLLIALAQATSILLTSDTLSASGVYEQVARYFWRGVGSTNAAKPSSPPLAIIFAIGMIAGSLQLSWYAPWLLALDGASATDIPAWRAAVGGFALAYGSRCAGGCTSGHGISGVAALSFSSLVSVASMFTAGILTQAIVS
ncbi:hypothetical protein K431DRAFT_292124 [Polychaeton citri CBS 116435]|uniref:Sulphur transport domain-containing protein n=1 Tax=Polychaeton citri CBS 116435 TaxID=1314669 RepID=A0A9P4QDD7_9PEZI|nr:hypothetical protein K431DRAFT_292124 [Polychaeton citri CBS 116435]